MRGNASICAEILTFFGMPAIAEGNLIQISNHMVNVEEACSGIRSLQTAFMMSLFLGEFHRLSVARRIGLMVASFVIAFLVNLVRTLVLTVSCDGPTRLAIGTRESRAGTAAADMDEVVGEPRVYSVFGLGAVGGTNLGGYGIR